MIVSWSVGRGLFQLPKDVRDLIVEALREIVDGLEHADDAATGDRFEDERFIDLAVNYGEDTQAAVDELPRHPRYSVRSTRLRLTADEKRILIMASGTETVWVAPRVGERTVADQRLIRLIDGLYARGLLYLTRCGPDGEDNRYRITDAGRAALEAP